MRDHIRQAKRVTDVDAAAIRRAWIRRMADSGMKAELIGKVFRASLRTVRRELMASKGDDR